MLLPFVGSLLFLVGCLFFYPRYCSRSGMSGAARVATVRVENTSGGRCPTNARMVSRTKTLAAKRIKEIPPRTTPREAAVAFGRTSFQGSRRHRRRLHLRAVMLETEKARPNGVWTETTPPPLGVPPAAAAARFSRQDAEDEVLRGPDGGGNTRLRGSRISHVKNGDKKQLVRANIKGTSIGPTSPLIPGLTARRRPWDP